MVLPQGIKINLPENVIELLVKGMFKNLSFLLLITIMVLNRLKRALGLEYRHLEVRGNVIAKGTTNVIIVDGDDGKIYSCMVRPKEIPPVKIGDYVSILYRYRPLINPPPTLIEPIISPTITIPHSYALPRAEIKLLSA